MKTTLTIFAFIMIATSAFAGGFSRWDTIPPNTRELMVKQYISGYMAGMNHGISEGIRSVINYTKTTGENTYIDSQPNIYATCSNIIGSNVDRIYDETLGWQQIQVRETKYYIDEMTKFLKIYPGCNKTDVADLIEILTPIWLNIEKKNSYEDVGRGCSK